MNAVARHSHPRIFVVFRRIALLWLLGPVLTSPLSSQHHILVESTKGSEIHITPGTLVTLPIRITNSGDQREYIAVFSRLPAGWRQVTSLRSAFINSGESAIRLLTVSPPKKVAAGTYPLTISVIDSSNKWTERLFTFLVIVERLVSYEILQTAAPRFSVGGDELRYEYEITNMGNDVLPVSIDARSTQGFGTMVNPPMLQIPVNTAGRVSVIVKSPSSLSRREKHGLVLTVTPQGEGEPQTLTTLSDVIPLVGSAKPDMLELPAYTALRVVGDNSNSGIQAEASGVGSLLQDKSDRLEFLLRSPETQSLSILGVRDEYRVRYSTKDLRLYAGDWNYSLTTLTEVGRYGFGFGGETDMNDLTLGGFFNGTRIGSPERQQAAAYARYALADNLRAGVNVFHRRERTDATVLSVDLETSLFRNSNLDLEAARSAGPGNTDAAVAARLNGSLPFGQYDIRYVNAGKNFASYYRDVQFASISMSAYASRHVRFDLLARDERRNSRLDTLIGFAPRTRFVQLGGGLSNSISVYYRASESADPISPSSRDRRDDVLQFRATQRFAFMHVAAYADFGTTTDRKIDAHGQTRRYAVQLSADPFRHQSYAASVEISRQPDFSSGVDAERISASFSANYRITDNTRAGLNLFTSRTVTPFDQRFTIADASVDHTFPFKHRVAGRLRSTNLPGTPHELAFSMEYGVPVAIPLGNITDTGVFSGLIIDESGTGIEGVYVTAGPAAAVTDEAGRFVLRDMTPGTHALNIDRGSLGIEHILDVSLPYEIEVIGGEETSVVLRTVTPGQLFGTVRLFNDVPTGIRDSVILTEVPVNGTVSLVVDLTNGPDQHRRITNAKGQFSIADLRPGTWTVTFTPLSLPEYHAVERPQRIVTITSGKISQLAVRVIPRERRIRIIQEGGVLKPKR